MYRPDMHNFRRQLSNALATEVFLGALLTVFVIASLISHMAPWR